MHFNRLCIFELLFISFFIGKFQNLNILAPIFNSLAFSFIIKAPPRSTPILKYTTNWLDTININKLKQPLKKNHSCSFTPKRTRTSSSSNNDLLLTTLFGQVTGLLPFIRSWSTANSNATCVMLIDSVTRELMKRKKISETEVENSGIHLIDVGVFNPPKPIGAGLFMIPNLEFLARYGHHFKHIMIVDANDEAFQGDPFQIDYEWDNLGFFYERFTVGEEPTNKWWVGQLKAWFPSYNLASKQPNTGLITGTSDQILALGDLMISVWNVPHFPNIPHDQGMVSYLIMNSFMRDAGLEYFMRRREILGIYRYHLERTNEVYPDYNCVFVDDDALIVHYYTRDANSVRNIRKICNFDAKVPLKCDIRDEPKGRTPCRMK